MARINLTTSQEDELNAKVTILAIAQLQAFGCIMNRTVNLSVNDEIHGELRVKARIYQRMSLDKKTIESVSWELVIPEQHAGSGKLWDAIETYLRK